MACRAWFLPIWILTEPNLHLDNAWFSIEALVFPLQENQELSLCDQSYTDLLIPQEDWLKLLVLKNNLDLSIATNPVVGVLALADLLKM